MTFETGCVLLVTGCMSSIIFALICCNLIKLVAAVVKRINSSSGGISTAAYKANLSAQCKLRSDVSFSYSGCDVFTHPSVKYTALLQFLLPFVLILAIYFVCCNS